MLYKYIVALILAISLISTTSLAHANTSRGYFTSPQELSEVKRNIDAGDPIYLDRFEDLSNYAGTPTYWPYGTITGRLIVDSNGDCIQEESSSSVESLRYNRGGRLTYTKALMYHLTGNIEYAQAAREKILDLTDTTYFGGDIWNGANQCTLHLGFAISTWVQAADLLEGSSVWSATDKQQFQNWLADEVYTKVAWASRARSNNWGSAGSVSAAYIGDYVSDRTDLTLVEIEPVSQSFTPAQAYESHNQQQKDRMDGTFQGDSRCSIWGIQDHGGIPDELRRGAAGCEADSIQTDDGALTYQVTHVGKLIQHAEMLWHRGDTSMYQLMGDAPQPLLHQAIDFVIENPKNASSITWIDYKKGELFVTDRFYKDEAMNSVKKTITSSTGGTYISFGQLTHLDRNLVPPVVAAPGSSNPNNTPAPTPTPTTEPKQISLLPVEDAFTDSRDPSRNTGTSPALEVDGDPEKIVFLTFDLSSLENKIIESALLRLSITNSSSSTQEIRAVDNSNWSESTITYANQPAIGTTVTSISDQSASTTAEINLTNYIQNKNGFVSLALTSSGTDGLDFYSKENGIDQPELVITYEDSPSTSTCTADINSDGVVNIMDFLILSSNYSILGDNPADINNDGQVDLFDFLILSSNYGKTC